jgi:hypothetical protein
MMRRKVRLSAMLRETVTIRLRLDLLAAPTGWRMVKVADDAEAGAMLARVFGSLGAVTNITIADGTVEAAFTARRMPTEAAQLLAKAERQIDSGAVAGQSRTPN